MKKRPWFPLMVVAAVALTGCAETGIDAAQLKKRSDILAAEAKEPVFFNAGKSQPIGLAKVQFRIPRGTVVARYPWVIFTCNIASFYAKKTIVITWGDRRFTSQDVGLEDVFYDVLKGLNYNVTGDPGRLFDVQAERSRTVYEVGAQVTGLSMELCVIQDNILSKKAGQVKGKTEMSVRWQVYSRLERKVVFETRNTGKSVDTEGKFDGELALIDEAFADAARKLARDPKFFAAVSGDPRTRITTAATTRRKRAKKISISKVPLLKGRLRDHIDRVRSAVVTISQGGGHGSGFFIDARGFVLTNAHVVGDAKFVRIELFNERGILGEVVRIDKRRDVALILTEEKNFPALSIREKPAVITEDVYAIGTPLKRWLRTSVTKGTVSGFRDNPLGLKIIQADVDIQGGNSGGPLVDASGNVIAISVSGIGIEDYSVGVNFFIPIQDALRALDIQLKERSAETGDRTPK